MAKKPLFQIVDVSPDTIYTPGAKVIGRVTLTAESDIAVGSVIVTFTGRSKTKIYANREQTEAISRGRITLFSVSKTLYRGRYTLAKEKEFEWPFEFVFPEKPDYQNLDYYREAEHFECDADHILPPTFHSSPDDNESECYVVYELSATLERPGTFRSLFGKLTHTVPIHFSPPRSPNTTIPEESVLSELAETFNTTVSAPEAAATPQGFRDRVRSIFRSAPPPAVCTFTLTAKVPQTAIAGTFIPLTIELSSNDAPPPSNTSANPPPQFPIYLKHVTIGLQTVTKVRTPTQSRTWAGASRLRDFEPHFLLQSPNPSIPAVDNSTGEEVAQSPPTTPPFTDVIPLKSNLIPSFKTYNINRSYILSVDLTVSCNGATISTKYAACTLVLLPEHLASPMYEPPTEDPPPFEMDAPSSSFAPAAQTTGVDQSIARRPLPPESSSSHSIPRRPIPSDIDAKKDIYAPTGPPLPLDMHPAMRDQQQQQIQEPSSAQSQTQPQPHSRSQSHDHTAWVASLEDTDRHTSSSRAAAAAAAPGTTVALEEEQLPAYEERSSRRNTGPSEAERRPS